MDWRLLAAMQYIDESDSFCGWPAVSDHVFSVKESLETVITPNPKLIEQENQVIGIPLRLKLHTFPATPLSSN